LTSFVTGAPTVARAHFEWESSMSQNAVRHLR
jgi:hypothetical protein